MATAQVAGPFCAMALFLLKTASLLEERLGPLTTLAIPRRLHVLDVSHIAKCFWPETGSV